MMNRKEIWALERVLDLSEIATDQDEDAHERVQNQKALRLVERVLDEAHDAIIAAVNR